MAGCPQGRAGRGAVESVDLERRLGRVLRLALVPNPKTAQPFPRSARQPRVEAIAGADDQKPVWRFSRIDFGGPWCPKALTQVKLVEVIGKLAGFESQNWPQIQGTGHSHFVDIDRLTPEARRRLIELKLDDTEQLFSLRLSGRERIWGIRIRNVMLMLWWDPQHQICPAHLR